MATAAANQPASNRHAVVDKLISESAARRRVRPHTAAMSGLSRVSSKPTWSPKPMARAKSMLEQKTSAQSEKPSPAPARRQMSAQQLNDSLRGVSPGSSIAARISPGSGVKSRSATPSRQGSSLAKALHLDELVPKKKKVKTRATHGLAKLGAVANLVQTKLAPKIKRKDGLTPLQRFRKAARLVKLLVTVSNVCRDLLVYAIKDEQWYEFCEKFLKDASAGGTPARRDVFMTTIRNPLTKEFEQLEFDASQFKRDYHSGASLLTNEIKNILTKRPGTRTAREIEDCLICIKRLVPVFGVYSYDQQKSICQHAMYDRYFQERVILREGLPPDGIYFVLNGTLMESGAKTPEPKLIKPGDKFGEEDLKNGMTRQSNVVSKSSVDLLYLHKFDYEEIFELTVDLSDDHMRVFDACRSHQLFKYYPVIELVRNPARWQVLKFKYGRLIAANSCETEFLYVIRSGEARVIKYLRTRTINVLQRRRRLQEELDSSDPYSNKKKLLDFVSDNALRSGLYKFNAFTAKNVAAEPVPIGSRLKKISSPRKDQSYTVNNTGSEFPDTDAIIGKVESWQNVESEEPDDDIENQQKEQQREPSFPFQRKFERDRAKTALHQQNRPDKPKRPHTTKPNRQATGRLAADDDIDLYRKRKSTMKKMVPPFVQVDFLQAGAIFGMRSLLPQDQKGEPVALVSAGCEVIQINRKFFAKYLDENMLGIVALEAKAYPNEDNLLKRLDMNLQWEEYCADVMCGYLDTKQEPFRGAPPIQSL